MTSVSLFFEISIPQDIDLPDHPAFCCNSLQPLLLFFLVAGCLTSLSEEVQTLSTACPGECRYQADMEAWRELADMYLAYPCMTAAA